MFWISAAIVWGAVFWGYVYKRSEEAKRIRDRQRRRAAAAEAIGVGDNATGRG